MAELVDEITRADAIAQETLCEAIAQKLTAHPSLAELLQTGDLLLCASVEMLIFVLKPNLADQHLEALDDFVRCTAQGLSWSTLELDQPSPTRAVYSPDLYSGLEYARAIALRGIFGLTKETAFRDGYPEELVALLARATLCRHHYAEGVDGKGYFPKTGCSGASIISKVNVGLFPFTHALHQALHDDMNYLAGLLSRHEDVWHVASICDDGARNVYYMVYRPNSLESAEAALQHFDGLMEVKIELYADDGGESVD